MNLKEELEKFRDSLEQQRDELLVQAGLAKLEARDEWEKTERKLEEFRTRMEDVADETREASEDVWVSIKVLGEEIKMAYERIRSKL